MLGLCNRRRGMGFEMGTGFNVKGTRFSPYIH